MLTRLALAVFLVTTPLLAQTPEQQILQQDSAWSVAEDHHDVAALDRILDDAFVTTSASGQTRTKSEFLKSVATSTSTGTQDLSDRSIHLFGETAILTETDNYQSITAGKTTTGALRLTVTYQHRADRWVAIAEQMTSLEPHGDPAAAEEKIRQLDSDWVNAAQSKDINAWLSFYSDDAIILPPNDKAATGKAAARKSISELLGLTGISLTWQPTKVEVAKAADLATLVGTYDLSYSDATGKRISDIGKILEVWKLQPDGKWKCIADTWNSDLPVTSMP